jgi:hypothetical protein
LRIAASYIEGKPLPDGTPFEGERGRVVWCEGEGSQALNMARAKDWGLDLSGIVSPLPDAFTGFRMDDEQHMLNLLQVCRKPDVRLVVIDSLTSVVVGGPSASGAPSKSVQGIPRAMQQMREFGRFLRRPILLTHHLRKQTTHDKNGFINLERLRGTSKIAQMARVVWTLDAPNQADLAHRRLAVAKNNLMPLAEPIGMRITENGPLFGDPPQPQITTTPTQPEIAADFLLELLADGPLPYPQILQAAQKLNLTEAPLRRAKKQLNIQSQRLPNDTIWAWYFPKDL